MSNVNVTVFLEPETSVRGSGMPHPTLYIEPEGSYSPGYVAFVMPHGTSPEDRVRIAEALVAGVTAWRDKILHATEAGDES